MLASSSAMRGAVFNSLCAVLLGVSTAECAPNDTPPGRGANCAVERSLTPMRDLREASGLTVSRRTPGLLWSHNDSGEPLLFAVDSASAAVVGRVRVAGAQVDDWEDVTAGSCPQGACLYIADIGDNNRQRGRITIYRVPEPRRDDPVTQPAESFEAVYPDGAHDAEALFVTADAVYIVTKAGADSTALYKLPQPLRAGPPLQLQRVGMLPLAGVTDADTSPDGAWTALRTNDDVLFYRTRDLVSGQAAEPRRFDVTGLGEPQGEGVTLDGNGRVYLAGEGGGGTLAGLRCTLGSPAPASR